MEFDVKQFSKRFREALGLLRKAKSDILLIIGIYGLFYGFYTLVSCQIEVTALQAVDIVFGLLGGLLLPFTNAMALNALRRAHYPRGGVPEGFAENLKPWLNLFTAYLGIGLIFIGYLALFVIPTYGLLLLWGEAAASPVWLALPVAGAALWVFGRFIFVDQLVVLEGKRPWQARQDSIALVKKEIWNILPTVILLYLLPLALDVSTEFINASPTFRASSEGQGLSLLLGIGAAVGYLIPMSYFYLYYDELTQKSRSHSA